jgi:hypothetical protein
MGICSWHRIMGIPHVGYERTWCKAIHADDREICSLYLKQSKDTGKPVSFEYRVMEWSNGAYTPESCKWVRSEVLPINNEAGEFSGYYATVTDITPLKLAEVAQKERADEALERTKQQGGHSVIVFFMMVSLTIFCRTIHRHDLSRTSEPA